MVDTTVEQGLIWMAMVDTTVDCIRCSVPAYATTAQPSRASTTFTGRPGFTRPSRAVTARVDKAGHGDFHERPGCEGSRATNPGAGTRPPRPLRPGRGRTGPPPGRLGANRPLPPAAARLCPHRLPPPPAACRRPRRRPPRRHLPPSPSSAAAAARLRRRRRRCWDRCGADPTDRLPRPSSGMARPPSLSRRR
jgi:hypothetical protein